MSSALIKLLEERGIKTVLIVDDAFDIVPLKGELDDDDCDHFLDEFDFSTVDPDLPFASAVAKEEDASLDIPEFLAWLWENQDASEITRRLFRDYKAKARVDVAFLGRLQATLEELGLTCETVGRNFKDSTCQPDLIIIDLFLGIEESQTNAALSMDGLESLLEILRPQIPPVILMSRSTHLEEYRETYRKRSGVFEALFRIEPKLSLEDPKRIHLAIERLVKPLPQARAYTDFLLKLDAGLEAARATSIELFRNLSLSDVRQLHELSLQDEKAPLGGYLVDLFDRTHQHEIESQTAIITSAGELSAQDLESIPPSHVGSNTELQALLSRALTEHPERLALPKSRLSDISFGDILRPSGDASAKRIGQILQTRITDQTVFAVMTPGCDLQHTKNAVVHLLCGTRTEHSGPDGSYSQNGIETLALPFEGKTYHVAWDKKRLVSISGSSLQNQIKRGKLIREYRLRESHAAGLSQSIYSSLSRVAEPVTPPMTHDVSVQAFVPGADGQMIDLTMGLEGATGRIYIRKNFRLLLREQLADSILMAVADMPIERVLKKARKNFELLRDRTELGSQLSASTTFGKPRSKDTGTPSPWVSTKLEPDPPDEIRYITQALKFAYMASDAVPEIPDNLKSAGLFILLTRLPEPTAEPGSR